MATTRHRSLVERGGRKALLDLANQKKSQQKTDIHESEERDMSTWSFQQSN